MNQEHRYPNGQHVALHLMFWGVDLAKMLFNQSIWSPYLQVPGPFGDFNKSKHARVKY